MGRIDYTIKVQCILYTINKEVIMDSIEVKGYAKINLSLDVIKRYENGYHEVEMIMQQVSLFDLIKLKKMENGLTIKTNSPFVPDNHKNIAYKIAKDIMDRNNISGLSIDIDKSIPVAAGLAGGSADAAAVIQGMNVLFNLQMTKEVMQKIAVKYGADIPFCIEGGAAIARGIGDELENIPSLKKVWFVLCKPPIGVSTAEVYTALEIEAITKHPDTQLLLKAMQKNDYQHLAKNMYNVLEEVTSKKYVDIEKLRKKMNAYGAIGTMMSGSGPTVFGIFKNYKSALQAEKNLKKNYREVFLVTTIDGGKHE